MPAMLSQRVAPRLPLPTKNTRNSSPIMPMRKILSTSSPNQLSGKTRTMAISARTPTTANAACRPRKNVAEPFSCSASTEDAEYTISRPKHTKVNRQVMNIRRGRMMRAGTPAI